jgi:hypothetical protein
MAVLLRPQREVAPGRLKCVPLTGDRRLFLVQTMHSVLQGGQVLVIDPWIGYHCKYFARADFAAHLGEAGGHEAFDWCAQRGDIGRHDRVVACNETLHGPDRVGTDCQHATGDGELD